MNCPTCAAYEQRMREDPLHSPQYAQARMNHRVYGSCADLPPRPFGGPLVELAILARRRGGWLGWGVIVGLIVMVLATIGALHYQARLDRAQGACPDGSLCAIFRAGQ